MTARILRAKPLLLSLLVLFVFAVTVIWPWRSNAVRNPVQTVDGKRHRPEFVPGEALVRFKPGRAVEGLINLTIGRKELSATPTDDGSVLQVTVEIDRFDGSDLVDGLRIARMAPDDTLQSVAALTSRDDVIYAEPTIFVTLRCCRTIRVFLPTVPVRRAKTIAFMQ